MLGEQGRKGSYPCILEHKFDVRIRRKRAGRWATTHRGKTKCSDGGR